MQGARASVSMRLEIFDAHMQRVLQIWHKASDGFKTPGRRKAAAYADNRALGGRRIGIYPGACTGPKVWYVIRLRFA